MFVLQLLKVKMRKKSWTIISNFQVETKAGRNFSRVWFFCVLVGQHCDQQQQTTVNK